MNPNSGENLPKFEVPRTPEEGSSEASYTEKQPVSSPENKPQKQAVQTTSQVASDLALPAQSVSTTTDDQNDISTEDKSIKEGDKIEKEWIDRAKAIVAKTQDDPYEQKNAMSQVKADYIRKRFNKTVKINDPTTK